MVQKVPLTGGKYAIVDDEDHGWISRYKWQFGGGGYPMRGVNLGNRNFITVYMHRLIMRAGPSEQVDHIDGNTLDNRRSNLRRASHTQNARNSVKRRSRAHTSRFKGVCWVKSQGRWRAYITVDRRRIHLGRYFDEEQAARAYDRAAVEHFGEFARLNFPEVCRE